MKLTLIDNEHGFDKKGHLYVRVDGKWERLTSEDQDRMFERLINDMLTIEE